MRKSGRSISAIAAVTALLVLTIAVSAMAAWRWRRPPLQYHSAPMGVTTGVPDRPLRFVSYNILHNQRGKKAVIDQIRQLRPDFVLLQEVERRDVDEMARALGIRNTTRSVVYYPSENLAGRRAFWGNAILSAHPLCEAASIPNPGGGSFGIWAASVVDGRKFYVAWVHLSATWRLNVNHIRESSNHRHNELTNLVRAWQARGSPPTMIGGDFNQLPAGDNYFVMTQHFSDALAALGRSDNTFKDGLLRTRIDYFLTSGEFRIADGGVAFSDASDHRPIWLEARGAK
jgi:endonuclease/exonuclease/phosphatase family metal-dependent hydrolase